jgi:hypothetical protein
MFFTDVQISLETASSSSGKWRHVDIVLTEVLEERIASIFRIEGKEGISERTSVSRC